MGCNCSPTGPGALFWCAETHADKYTQINESNNAFTKTLSQNDNNKHLPSLTYGTSELSNAGHCRKLVVSALRPRHRERVTIRHDPVWRECIARPQVTKTWNKGIPWALVPELLCLYITPNVVHSVNSYTAS